MAYVILIFFPYCSKILSDVFSWILTVILQFMIILWYVMIPLSIFFVQCWCQQCLHKDNFCVTVWCESCWAWASHYHSNKCKHLLFLYQGKMFQLFIREPDYLDMKRDCLYAIQYSSVSSCQYLHRPQILNPYKLRLVSSLQEGAP